MRKKLSFSLPHEGDRLRGHLRGGLHGPPLQVQRREAEAVNMMCFKVTLKIKFSYI